MSEIHDVTPVIQRSSSSELPQQDKLSNGYQNSNRQHQTSQQKLNIINNGETDSNNNNQNRSNKKTPPPVPLKKQSRDKSEVLIKTETTELNNDLSIKSDKNNQITASSSEKSEKNNLAPVIDRCNNENDSQSIQDNLNRHQQQQQQQQLQYQNINDNKGQSNHSSIVYQKADNVCCTDDTANCCSKQNNSGRFDDCCHNGKQILYG